MTVSTFEALTLMLSFGMFVVTLMQSNKKG
ncbi:MULTISPECIES: putative holin-like toxin [Scopulibacillus]|uniref:Holin-like toxin n=1 Tax=Scopulibacillus cellulosilyticus TaxID=2665665 RepID=A0ABW2PVM9_9BACL